jgi:hypothetical protein
VVFTLSFVLTSRDKAFYIIFVHAAATTINKNLKIIYRNPRPYMVSPELTAFGCSKSFGNPSGHSSLSACLYTSIFLIMFHDHVDHYKQYKKFKRNQSFQLAEPLLQGSARGSGFNGACAGYDNREEESKDHGFFYKLKYLICLMLTVTIIISVGLSRVALGVHSFN